MKGRIKKYFPDKGYGFIVDVEGSERFFHVSDIVTEDDVFVGVEVKFSPSSNTKGLTASNVTIEKNNRPEFIKFGDVRIKTSNIKNYGLAEVNKTKFEKIPLSEKQKNINNKKLKTVVVLTLVDRLFGGGSNPSSDYKDFYAREKKIEVSINVLYVTTYSRDNFEFHDDEVDFDVKEKASYLDSILS